MQQKIKKIMPVVQVMGINMLKAGTLLSRANGIVFENILPKQDSTITMYNTHNITTIRQHLLSRGETVAVAESVTSGHLQAALSQADGAIRFFQGGITTYNLGQKTRHLHVDPIHAQSCDSVSEKVAEEMAAHVCSLFSSDWGIAITGYAALVPELNIHYLYAYYAFGYRGHPVMVRKIESRVQAVLAVQQYYTDVVLENFVNSCLMNHNHLKDSKFHPEISGPESRLNLQ